MKSTLRLTIFVSALLSTISAFGAQPGCTNSKVAALNPELCGKILAHAKIRTEVIEREGGLTVPETGAVFTKANYPLLGEAYTDPSGLAWGSLMLYETRKGSVYYQAQEAAEFCKSINARLPTKKEAERLISYLSNNKVDETSLTLIQNKLADGQTEIIPGLTYYRFWTSTKRKIDFLDFSPHLQYVMAADSMATSTSYYAELGWTDHIEGSGVRCVIQTK